MGANVDSWGLLSKIAAHGRRLRASEEVAHWTLRIIIESHMRSAGFTLDSLRELLAILGHEALQQTIDGLLDGDAVRLVSALERGSARRARNDPAWARKYLMELAGKPSGARANEDPDGVLVAPQRPAVRVLRKHRSLAARRRLAAPPERI